MTRFSNPGPVMDPVVEHDFSTYSFTHGSWLWVLENLTNLPLNSGTQVLLVYHEWPLHVGVSVTVVHYMLTHRPNLNFHSQMGVLDNY